MNCLWVCCISTMCLCQMSLVLFYSWTPSLVMSIPTSLVHRIDLTNTRVITYKKSKVSATKRCQSIFPGDYELSVSHFLNGWLTWWWEAGANTFQLSFMHPHTHAHHHLFMVMNGFTVKQTSWQRFYNYYYVITLLRCVEFGFFLGFFLEVVFIGNL